MDSDLTQVERHQRAIGIWTHAEGSARVQHEQGGTIWSDPTENLDVAHVVAADSGQLHHDSAGRLSSTSHPSFGIFIALLLYVVVGVDLDGRDAAEVVHEPTCVVPVNPVGGDHFLVAEAFERAVPER